MKENNNLIDSKLIAHSRHYISDEIVTQVYTCEVIIPKYLLAQLNTHRTLVKNAASSRAIPSKKIIESVKESPFIPLLWAKAHKGMQATEYYTKDNDISFLLTGWYQYIDATIAVARFYSEVGISKQIVNRLLEPFMYTKVIVTGTDEAFDNFFKLRCSYHEHDKRIYDKNNLDKYYHSEGLSDIHMQMVADSIYTAIITSPGLTTVKLNDIIDMHIPYYNADEDIYWNMIKSVVTCARVSYTDFRTGLKDINDDNIIRIFKILYNNSHMSPFEHIQIQSGRDFRIEEGDVRYSYKFRTHGCFVTLRYILEKYNVLKIPEEITKEELIEFIKKIISKYINEHINKYD